MTRPSAASTLALAAVLGLALAGAPAAAQERAGYVERIQQDGYQAVSATGIRLDVGAEIFRDARLYTKAYGTIESHLADGTALTIAPNSSIVVDEFVFAGGAPSLAMTLSRGAVRIVSGRLPKEAYRVNTPVASIGVRGTDYWLDASPDRLQVWVTEGAVVATPVQSGQEFVLTAPAYAVCDAVACRPGPPPPTPSTYPPDPRGFRGDGGDGGEGGDSGGDR